MHVTDVDHRDAWKVWCDVCHVFETDATGRCPLCQPSATGDLVGDLLAERLPAQTRLLAD